LSFDPNDSYGVEDIDYYTLWHFKSGKWTSYGKLPHQNPIHYGRSRPFQIKLEVAKWGLNPGWHIIYIKSFSEHGTDMPTNKKILRFRHTGSRIIEGQTGYKEPNYYDDNWEILDERTFETISTEDPDSEHYWGTWYSGEVISWGRGVYDPNFGIIYDSIPRSTDREWVTTLGEYPNLYIAFEYLPTYGWNPDFGNFYMLREYCVAEGTAPSACMGFLVPWPGTTNRIYGALWDPYGDASHKQPLYLNPSSANDGQPWDVSNLTQYHKNWMTGDPRDWPDGVLNTSRWRSNFFFVASSYDYGELSEIDSHILFQGGSAGKWTTLESITYNSELGAYNQPAALENSMWDWAWDGSCAESNMQIAYVRRKSDGSIWRFRNWKPTGNVYTDFPNLAMRPVEPIPGVEYASFFMNGPPIPGNETWNTLMVLK